MNRLRDRENRWSLPCCQNVSKRATRSNILCATPFTFNGDACRLPTPAATIFTSISRTNNSATVVLRTTPYFLLTLQTAPYLSLPNWTTWTTIATITPVTNTWTFTDATATKTVTQRFYRAFITTP